MPEDKESLLNTANASGFLFQLGVEQEVRRLQQHSSTDWKVVASEYRWLDPVSSSEKFIDLVLQSNASRMVIECKRVQDAIWLFLISEGRINMGRARLYWTYPRKQQRSLCGWDEFKFLHASPEASFCIVRGHGESDSPMLERLAGIVLRSTEVLANNELDLGHHRISGPAWIYIPMIITNANLMICKFNPDKIDLQSGKLSDADFVDVPMVRFRKSLSTIRKSSNQTDSKSYEEIIEEQQRTVLVVNVRWLSDILSETGSSTISAFGPGKLPWDLAANDSID